MGEWLFGKEEPISEADLQENYFAQRRPAIGADLATLKERIAELEVENKHLLDIIEALKVSNLELAKSNEQLAQVKEQMAIQERENAQLKAKLSELLEYVSLILKIDPPELRHEQYEQVKNRLVGFLYRELRMKVAFPFSHALSRINTSFSGYLKSSMNTGGEQKQIN